VSDLTIWDRLAELDGACKHKWEYIETKSICFDEDAERWKCTKCSLSLWTDGEDLLPSVGDGRNEERYGTVDELIGLCDRLGLHVTLHVSKKSQIDYIVTTLTGRPSKGLDDDPRMELATAICRAMEVRE